MAARAETPGFDLTVHANQRPQEGRFNLVHASDVEGPIFLGDDARDIVSKFVRPPQPKDGIDYGAIFYDEVHCAIKEEYMNKGLGQIGSNIVLYLPALLYFGATDRRLLMQALQSRRTPGSSDHIGYLRSKNSYLVAVTTAWKEPHAKMVLENERAYAGFDELAATDFPIDEIRDRMQDDNSGNWHREMAMTGRWLHKIFALIEKRAETTDPAAKAELTERLKGKIIDFYKKEVGITWNAQGQTISFHLTQLGDEIAKLNVIGDYGKAVVVRRLVRQNLLQPDAPGVIVWGDGVNDATMLGDSEGATWRVAFNGSQAARTANIGVISEEIGRPGIVLTQIFEEHFKKYKERRPDRNQIAEVVNEAQARVGKDIIIHVAGPETDHGLLEEHEKMKTKIRGPRASTIDNLHV